MPGADHDWQRIDRFEELHRRGLEQAEQYFVIAHDLHEPVLRSPTRLRYRGILSCHGGIELHVDDHRLERDQSNRCRTARVSYHAQISAPRVMPILRYDTAKHYRDHPDAFHKHVFDAAGGQAEITHIGREAFPTLRNVIDEVFEWWKAHGNDPRYRR